MKLEVDTEYIPNCGVVVTADAVIISYDGLPRSYVA
jgi:hypothetical protein